MSRPSPARCRCRCRCRTGILVTRAPAAVFAGLLALCTSAASAIEMPVRWDASFLFAGGGLENPLLRVAFNPQPEPPAAGSLTLRDPLKDGYPPDPVITHSGAQRGDTFRLLFGITSETPLVLPESVMITPPAGEVFAFDVLDGSAVAGVKLFHVELILESSSGGTPMDWVAFNPQPEPPAFGLNGDAFGADFGFTSFSDVTLRIRLMNAVGDPIALQLLPAPGTTWLLVAGVLLALMAVRKREVLRSDRDIRLVSC